MLFFIKKLSNAGEERSRKVVYQQRVRPVIKNSITWATPAMHAAQEDIKYTAKIYLIPIAGQTVFQVLVKGEAINMVLQKIIP